MKTYKSIYNTPEYRKRYTGIYGSWYAMKQRCGNKNVKQFKDYGGRGIRYDEKWENFGNFKKDMGDSYLENLTIERIDTNGNYSKENCRWATRKEQNNNKRCNHILSFNGKSMTLPQWAENLGISYWTLRSRFYRGMPMERIMENKILSRWD